MSEHEKIGAFFDLDGTLLAPPSLEWNFLTYLLARDEIRTVNVARWLAHSAKYILRDPREATLGNKHYLAGVPQTVIADWEHTFSSTTPPLFIEGTNQMKWHLERRHQVFLVTGTLAPLARAIARHMPCGVEVCATELEICNGHFTGRLVGAHTGYTEKARVLRKVAAVYRIDLARSYAYGNQMSDFQMLDTVGNPAAVNPSWRLERAARKRDWIVSKWIELRQETRTKESKQPRLGVGEARNRMLTEKAAR
jgi:HAD superfamily hydrolase (TIGR01490 family)